MDLTSKLSYPKSNGNIKIKITDQVKWISQRKPNPPKILNRDRQHINKQATKQSGSHNSL